MLNKSEIIKKMERYLAGNLDEARNIVSQINGWDESLEELYVYSMCEFNDVIECAGLSPSELINRVQYGNFYINNDYFKFDELGNLVSYSEYEYEELVEEYIPEIVERYIERSGHVYTDKEMIALMEAYDELDYDC